MVMHTEDRGLLYAEACFETFRVVDGEIFGWREHEARLRLGLGLFGLDLPDGLKQRCLAKALEKGDDVLQRITVTGGVTSRELLPKDIRNIEIFIQSRVYEPRTAEVHLCTVAWPLPLYPRPAKLTADYAQTIRGLHDLRNRGFLSEDKDALICDADMLYSATTSNILLFVDGTWLTPDADAVVPGVVRQVLLEAGVARACSCPRSLADKCEAMALTNSGWFIRPVASINGRPLCTHGASFEVLVSVLEGQPGVPENIPCK